MESFKLVPADYNKKDNNSYQGVNNSNNINNIIILVILIHYHMENAILAFALL